MNSCRSNPMHPFENVPYLPDLKRTGVCAPPPGENFCFELWDKYGMLENVRRHSLMVAHIATSLASRAYELALPIDVEAVRASALLHDIAKTYCLKYGGSHAMLGGGWVVRDTGNYAVAQGVILHVHWPWPLPTDKKICSLPFFVLYADKRVRHDACVTLEDRFEDLLARYGKTEAARQGIRESFEQAKAVEKNLENHLEMTLHENTFDCGRLVQ